MKTIETKVYEYDELDEDAQERAREWAAGWMSGEMDLSWVEDDFQTDMQELGFEKVKVTGYSVGSYDDYATWSGSLTDPVKLFMDNGFLTAVAAIQDGAEWFADVITERSGQDQYVTVQAQVWSYDDDGETVDQDPESKLEEWFKGWARDKADDLRKMFRDAWEYELSDESLAELIQINDYTFTIDGRRFG